MYVSLGICGDGLQTTKEVRSTDPLGHELLFLAEYYSNDGFQVENLSQETQNHVTSLINAVGDRRFERDEFQTIKERDQYDRVTLACLTRYDWVSCATRFLDTAKVDGNFTEADRQKLSVDYALALGHREGGQQQAFDRLFDSYTAARKAYDQTQGTVDFDWLYSVERAMRCFIESHGDIFFIDVLKRSSRGREGHIMTAFLLAHIGWTNPEITDELVTNVQHSDPGIREAARYAFQNQGMNFEGVRETGDIVLISVR